MKSTTFLCATCLIILGLFGYFGYSLLNAPQSGTALIPSAIGALVFLLTMLSGRWFTTSRVITILVSLAGIVVPILRLIKSGFPETQSPTQILLLACITLCTLICIQALYAIISSKRTESH